MVQRAGMPSTKPRISRMIPSVSMLELYPVVTSDSPVVRFPLAMLQMKTASGFGTGGRLRSADGGTSRCGAPGTRDAHEAKPDKSFGVPDDRTPFAVPRGAGNSLHAEPGPREPCLRNGAMDELPVGGAAGSSSVPTRRYCVATARRFANSSSNQIRSCASTLSPSCGCPPLGLLKNLNDPPATGSEPKVF